MRVNECLVGRHNMRSVVRDARSCLFVGNFTAAAHCNTAVSDTLTSPLKSQTPRSSSVEIRGDVSL